MTAVGWFSVSESRITAATCTQRSWPATSCRRPGAITRICCQSTC